MRLIGNNRGFTLIELMITVVIVAILATIAIPSYQEYVIRARRADAQGTLMGLANALERFHTQNGTYAGAAAGGGDTGAPAIYASQSPIEGAPKAYDLAIQAADGSTFTIRATPIGPQVGDGYLETTSTGARRWDQNNDNDTDDPGETSWD